MRILNQDNDTAVDTATLYLTESETKILSGYLEQLLEMPQSSHCHLESDDLAQEITVTLVREEQLEEYNERSRQLWKTGK
jgi:hypothetical protein